MVQLSHVKLSDQGLGLLLHYPLLSLRNLDLSHTEVTVGALEHLPTGGCDIQIKGVVCLLVGVLRTCILLEVQLNTANTIWCQ